MIPISDDNPGRHTPFITWILVASCVLAFIWQLTLTPDAEEQVAYALGFVPAFFFSDDPDTGWPALTLFTSLFLHGGLMHLAGNMLYLWIFGNNVEDALGHIRYLVFYVVCGVAASLAHGIVDSGSTVPVIGASGAISGVLAAYVLVFPRTRITVIIPLGVLLYPTKISALYVVGFWFVIQLISAALTPPGEPGVAWWAHVGGFGAGLLLTPFLSRFPLFGRWRRGPSE